MAFSESSHAAQWRDFAARTRRKVNAGWWVQAFAPCLVLFGAVAFGVIFYLRATWRPMDPLWVTGSLLGAALLCAGGAWLWAKRRFYSTEECLVRLEGTLRMNNALSAAAAGVSPWPAPPPADRVTDGFQWRWQWIAGPVAMCAAALLLAFLVPVRPPEGNGPGAYLPPSSLEQAEKMVNELKKDQVARKEDLEKFEKAIDALKHTPAEDWYSHSNLEAADNLKDTIKQAASDLSGNYEKAASSLEKLDSAGANGSEAARQQAAQEFSNAMQGLKSGSLQPNKDLMKALEQIDPKELSKQMSKEQLQQLREQLKKNGKCAGNCSSDGPGQRQMGDTEKALRDALANEGNGEGQGDEEQSQEGEGSPERGPGVAPLKMSRKESDLKTNNPEKAESRDLNRMAPGDLIGTTSGEHEVDKTKVGSQEAGAASGEGKGGEAIWRENLLPEEKRVLKRFFK